jgi:O-antigen/teichoic acid export membrane protein
VSAVQAPVGGRRQVVVGLARRAGWNIVDQGLSSLSNLTLSLLVARAVDADAFGAFTVCFTVYSVAVLASRSLASTPLPMRFAAADRADFRTAAAQSAGAAAVLGVVMGLAVLVAGSVIGGGVGVALLALAPVMPGLTVQDAWRMAFFAERRPERAALVDGAWMVVQTALVAVLLAVGAGSPAPFVLAWGVAATVAAVIGAQRLGVAPRVRSARAWLRAHWDLTRFMTLESVLLQGAYQGALLLVGAVGTLAYVGYLRGAQVVLGPVSLLAASAMAFGVPEMARRVGMTARMRVLAAAGLGGLLGLAGVAWGVLVLLLPHAWGVQLLGDSWDGVRALLLASLVGQVGNLTSSGPACAVYAMAKAKEAFHIHAALSVALVAFGVGGLWVGGAEGAAWGFAAAYWLAVPFWFLTVHRLGRQVDAERAAAAPVPETPVRRGRHAAPDDALQ